MRKKTFIVIVILFCILLSITFFISREKKPSAQQALMGTKLFENFPVELTETITIKSPDGLVILKKGKDFWGVENRYHYRANFDAITGLVKKLRNAKIGRSFQASEKVLARLGLYSPDKADKPKKEKGARITLTDKDKKNLADIIIGQPGDKAASSDTFYVKPVDQPIIYQIDQNFRFLDKKPAQWIEQELIDLNPKDVSKVICYKAGTKQVVYTIQRTGKDRELVLVNLPPGKKPVKYKLDQVTEALSAFKIEDVVDPVAKLKASTFSDAHYFEYFLSDGTIYHVYLGTALGDSSENHYFKVNISYVPPAAEKKDDKEKDKEVDGEKVASEAKLQGRKLSAWTYVISKWVNNTFITNPEDFIEKEEKK